MVVTESEEPSQPKKRVAVQDCEGCGPTVESRITGLSVVSALVDNVALWVVGGESSSSRNALRAWARFLREWGSITRVTCAP